MTTVHTKRAQGGTPKRVDVQPFAREQNTPSIPRFTSPLTLSVRANGGERIALVATSIDAIGLGIEDGGTPHVVFIAPAVARELAARLIAVAEAVEQDQAARAYAQGLLERMQAKRV